MRIAEFDLYCYFCKLGIKAISINCIEKMRCIFFEKNNASYVPLHVTHPLVRC